MKAIFSRVRHPSHPGRGHGSLTCHKTQFERSDWLRSENFINIMIEYGSWWRWRLWVTVGGWGYESAGSAHIIVKTGYFYKNINICTKVFRSAISRYFVKFSNHSSYYLSTGNRVNKPQYWCQSAGGVWGHSWPKYGWEGRNSTLLKTQMIPGP